MRTSRVQRCFVSVAGDGTHGSSLHVVWLAKYCASCSGQWTVDSKRQGKLLHGPCGHVVVSVIWACAGWVPPSLAFSASEKFVIVAVID